MYRYTDLSYPLMFGKRTGNNIQIERFIGTSTLVDGKLFICKHYINQKELNNNGYLVVQVVHEKENWIPKEVWLHPKYDIGYILLDKKLPNNQFSFSRHEVYYGKPVETIGYVLDPTEHSAKNLDVICLVGNIVKLSKSSSTESPHICEVSFTSINGMSGSPLIYSGTKEIAGILYGNGESHITVYSSMVYEEKEFKYSEKTNRIIERGLFHSSNDILSELSNFKKVIEFKLN